MEFTATVRSLEAGFNVRWGDTVRERDIYTPFFVLKVQLAPDDARAFPGLQHLLLYSFQTYAANVWDEFDEEACIQRSGFDSLEPGSRLHVEGPVHAKLATNEGTRFRGYDYVVVHPEKHGPEWDVNGWLHAGITEWLVEEEPIADEGMLSHLSHLVVAWECAEIILLA